MTWNMLLADYPRSVLTDEFYISILALLERDGWSTEAMIAAKLDGDLPRTTAALLELHRNDLIEVTRDFVAVSDRGRILLDRFSLGQDVLEDLLDGLLLGDLERVGYRSALSIYRQRAFTQYRDSLSTLRVWKDLATNCALASPAKYQGSPWQTGTLVLLLRDLRNWFVHNPYGAEPSSTDNVDIGVFLADPWVFTASQEKSFSKTHVAARWLHAFGEDDPQVVAPVSNDEEKRAFSSLRLFDTFQRHYASDAWLSVWVENIEKPNANRSLQAVCTALEGTIRELDQLVQSREGRWVSTVTTNPKSATDPVWSAEVFDALLGAPNLDEFAGMVGKSPQAARMLLATIQSRCQALLKSVEVAPKDVEPDGTT
jgi:hypothetical protein